MYLWWGDVTTETWYEIERRDVTASTSFALLSSTTADVISFSDFTVAASTTYSYRVRAGNSWGYSGYSNTATATSNP